MKYMSMVLFALTVAFNASATPEQSPINACLQYKTKNKQLACIDQLLNQVRMERKSWENQLITAAKRQANTQGRHDVLRNAKKSQGEYDRYIQSSCKMTYQVHLPNAQNAAIQNKSCEVILIKQRIEFLKSAGNF